MNDLKNEIDANRMDNDLMMEELCDDTWGGAVQSYSDDCAVMGQVYLLAQFGVQLTPERAVYECATLGWYTQDGETLPYNAGNLMDLYGVTTHTVQNATVADLAEELQLGRGVIIGLPSAEWWHEDAPAAFKNWFCETFGLDAGTFIPEAHAVVVTGIDVSSPGHPQLIINDSGAAEGQGYPCPLDTFMNVWENGNFSYTATDAPIPRDAGILGDADNLDMSKWLPGGVDGGVTTLATVCLVLADTEAEFAAGSAVEALFSDPSVIYSI